MRVELKGLHKTTKLLADGRKQAYYYAWKGGPRIMAPFGTPEFVEEFKRLARGRSAPATDTLAYIISLYKRMELPKLKPSTRATNLPYIKTIESEFGDMEIKAVEETGSRAVFLEWRDSMAATPRAADIAWSVLQRIMAFGVHMEKLKRNPCTNAGRLAESGTRREIIWTPPDIARFRAAASQQLADALTLAIWTGQRQGDLLRLQWSAYDGKHIRLKQGKTGRRVAILVSGTLAKMLERLKVENEARQVPALTILTNQRGQTWTSSGFKTSWGRAAKKAGISGLTFHDLRGTFITMARRAGASIEDIAKASGHTTKDIHSVLETHYLADDLEQGDVVILKLEANEK
ncbi:tyrosine-type recombinase/integrase [Agrobacterium vitis]|uniref:tyrosine-type recombinase/integrase n=1 Tax=Agrobacterium vitis TaxID=373 RepID=UPI001573A056|nr:tyrosine-type recombinase/integrase [Agrobacterium vitis]NSZ42803.1 tyrosine-type recombinase/integrase [Agrobacterium vitis]